MLVGPQLVHEARLSPQTQACASRGLAVVSHTSFDEASPRGLGLLLGGGELLLDLAADLAGPEARGVHVHVGGPGAQRLDKLGELSGSDALTRGPDHVPRN